MTTRRGPEEDYTAGQHVFDAYGVDGTPSERA
jgi:hypothetical protein